MHSKFHFTSRITNVMAKHKVREKKISFAIHFSVKPFLFQLTMPVRKIIFVISDYRTPLAADNDDLKNILMTLVLSPNKVKAFRHMISTMMLHFSLAIICNQMNLISKKSVLSLQWPCLQIKLYQKTTPSSHIALEQFIFFCIWSFYLGSDLYINWVQPFLELNHGILQAFRESYIGLPSVCREWSQA